MPARRLLWPLLVYGALGVIALALQGAPSGQRSGRRDRSLLERGKSASAKLADAARRAQERVRRRSAPWHIPWSDWKGIFWRVYQKLNDNRLLAVAGGVVFFSLLALFPAVAAFVSLYGLFADASTIDQHLFIASGILPGGGVDLLHEELTRLAAKSDSKLSFGFLFGLAFALWSANAGMKAMIDALNVAYEVKDSRSFIRLTLFRSSSRWWRSCR
jgi:membrane protein